MKTLLILRHAKSSWDDPELDDHDRPLNPRGLRDAPRMGKLLKKENLVPDLILSSTALRAKKTAEIAAETSNFKGKLELSNDLYLAKPEGYIKALQALPDKYQRVMVVGHNEGLEKLVGILAGTFHRFPTAALAWFELEIESWKDLKPGPKGKLRNLWRPKELKN